LRPRRSLGPPQAGFERSCNISRVNRCDRSIDWIGLERRSLDWLERRSLDRLERRSLDRLFDRIRNDWRNRIRIKRRRHERRLEQSRLLLGGRRICLGRIIGHDGFTVRPVL
jgi:hypothetical protein